MKTKDDAMSQSLSKILLHVVFSTKNRERWLVDDVRPSLHAYIAGICRANGCEAYRVGGTEDHIHIACTQSRTITASKLVEEVKRSSSRWLKEQGNDFCHFTWQAGYGVFSLGQSQLSTLIHYVDNQMDHHRKRTFQEEYLDFLKKYNVEYDERYLWK